VGNFQTALSALRASSKAIQTIGNNLANLNTAGFKRSSVEFNDVFSSVAGSGRMQVGGGVGQVFTPRTFDQGPVTGTGRPLDAAVQGPGFFVLRGGAGSSTAAANLYSRDGSFRLSEDGTLVNNAGLRVQGWNADRQTGTVNTGVPVGDIRVPLGTTIPATPTSILNLAANLDASAAEGTEVNAPLEVVDALGGVHSLRLTFTKNAEANSWSLSLSSTDPAIDGGDDMTSLLSVDTLTFDRGNLAPDTEPVLTISPIEFTTESGIPATGDITWNLFSTPPSGDPPAGGISGLTQYSQASVTSENYHNGTVSGVLVDARIADGGRIMGRFSNGEEVEVGRLALAGIRNPDTLVGMGGNVFRAGVDSTVLAPVDASSGSAGTVAGESMEGSNVDIAHEFTELITFQRGYQANSRVITTVDELTQETLSIKR
jgi:flagellar hook protein FlgE